MPKKPSLNALRRWYRAALFVTLAAALLASISACSEDIQKPQITSSSTEETETVSPSEVATPSPMVTPEPTPEPTPSPTPAPTPEVSFPPLKTTDAGSYTFPQVVADKTSAKTGEDVNFKIITSVNVKKIQTIIDGSTGKINTEYTADTNVRIWYSTIHFTVGGNRKVQYRCTMTSGGTTLIPKNPITINVTFEYTAESTSKTISSGKTVTFTLKTPSSIESVCAVVDGVKQNINFSTAYSDKGGVKVWKVTTTFFKVGTREVKFNAYVGSKVKNTFPDAGITIIVQSSV